MNGYNLPVEHSFLKHVLVFLMYLIGNPEEAPEYLLQSFINCIMYPRKLYVLLLMTLFPAWIICISEMSSPCPTIFVYDHINTKNKTWFGKLFLFTNKKAHLVTSIRILLDGEARELNLYNHKWQGRVESLDNREFLILEPNVIVKPGTTSILNFLVRFQHINVIPKLVAVRVNELTVCSGTLSLGTDNKYITRPWKEERSTMSTPTRYSTPSNYNEFKQKEECGKTVTSVAPLIINGEPSLKGQWPWHGALYMGDVKGLLYRCGMTLITIQHALTAAHCVASEQRPIKPVDLDSLLIVFGKTQLNQWRNSDSQEVQAKEIIIHPDYNTSNLHNDIAVIQFTKPVRITNWVRPVCLWQSNHYLDINKFVHKMGTVVGWGIKQNGAISNRLQHAEIPVVETLQCIYSDPHFYSLYSGPKSFCAGIPGKTSACNGDSGGGFVFQNNDTKIWHIRGIVSLSAADIVGNCDVKHYGVFTDVALFVDWIFDQIYV